MHVRSFADIRKLKLKLKRDDSVQITKAGGHFKARFHGRAEFAFGATPEEARERLTNGRLGITHPIKRRLPKLLKISLKNSFTNYEHKGTKTYEMLTEK